MEPFYRTTYSRYLHSLICNGFYDRGLDADDLEFLEYVKAHGSANGSLPSSGVVLLEELEFWHLPFTIAPGIERRVGKPPKLVESPEQQKLRQIRINTWHARRSLRKHEREIAAVELAREQREQVAAMKKRKLRQLISDWEWEKAAPHAAAFGKTIDRHHVPQWKLDEAPLVERKAKKQAALVEAHTAFDDEAKRKHAEAAVAKAHRTLARLAKAERELELKQQQRQKDYSRGNLKQAICAMLGHARGWTIDELFNKLSDRPFNCTNRQLFDECIGDLVESGQLILGKTMPK